MDIFHIPRGAQGRIFFLYLCTAFGGGRASYRAKGYETSLGQLHSELGNSACETLICYHDSKYNELDLSKIKEEVRPLEQTPSLEP